MFPYLPKLKEAEEEANDDGLLLPVEPREWDNRQSDLRIQRLADAIDVPPGEENVHSIPDPWARVILFARAMREEDHRLHARIVGEWRGLLAILGLRDILHLNEISATSIALDDKPVADSFLSTVSRVRPGKRYSVAKDIDWSRFHLLRWKGEQQKAEGVPRAFALTSPWTLVATGSDYADVLDTSEVPWFSGGLLRDPSAHLSEGQRRALAEWILYVREALAETGRGPNHGDIARRLDAFVRDLSVNLVPAPELHLAAEIISRNGLGLDDPKFYKIINFAHKSGTEIVTDVKIVATRHNAPHLVLIDDSLPAKLNRPDREIGIFGDITLSTAARHLPGVAAGASSGACPQIEGVPPMRWVRAGFFFQNDLIYEQPLAETGGIVEDTFPKCRKVVTEGRTAGRHIALPLTEEVAQLFTAKYLADNFKITWLDAGGAHCELRLEVQALAAPNAPGEMPQLTGPVHEVFIEHDYTPLDMIRVQKLPGIAIWPDFRFKDEVRAGDRDEAGRPTKTTNRWLRYYIFESWRGGNKDEFIVTPLQTEKGDSRLVREGDEYFQITTARSFPEFLVCRMPFNSKKPRTGNQNPPKGLLLPADPEVIDIRQKRSAALGIDFGTTGTSIYCLFDEEEAQHNHTARPTRVNFKDRLFRVAVGDQNEFGRATRDFFLPNQDWTSGKILSVFQDFGANDDGTHAAVRDGHVLYAQDVKSSAFVTGRHDSIRTNLKWGADKRENFAAQDFLSQICLQSLAELVVQGADSIEIRYSYPTAFSKADIEHLNSVWEMVLREVRKATDVTIPNVLRDESNREANCEAIAATRFFAHPENEVQLNVYRGAVTLDIGGGTTDIAVWNRDANTFVPALQAHLSVLFAGRDIFLAPLRLNPDLLKVIDESKEIAGALHTLSKLTKHSNAYNAEVDAIVSRYGNSLLEKLPGVALEPEVEQFLEILELGLCGIAFYTGLLIGRLILVGRYDSAQSRIPVFIGGNGSKLLRWCALGNEAEDTEIMRKFGACLLAGGNFASDGKLNHQQVEVALSKRPKEEVAFGLLVSDAAPYRANDFTNPLPGENYWVASAEGREERSWSQAPDVETLRTRPISVDPKLQVFSKFLEALNIPFDEPLRYSVADAIDREMGRMARVVRETPARGAAKPEDTVRRDPMFMIALKHLVHERVNKLVNHA